MDNGFYTGNSPMFDIDREKREVKRNFSRIFLALAVFLVTAIIVQIVVEVLIIILLPTKAEVIITSPYFLMGMNVFAMYLIAFPIFLYMTRNENKEERKREKTKEKPVELFILLLISWGAMYLGNLVGTLLNSVIARFLGHEIENDLDAIISSTPVWLLILVVVIIGPVVEELMFRRVMIDRLSSYGAPVAIWVSAVAFGLFHGNLYQFFYAALIGLVLGFIYTKTGRISYTIGIHMIINFFGSVVALYATEWMTKYEEMTLTITEGGEVVLGLYLLYSLLYNAYISISLGAAVIGIAAGIHYLRKNKFALDKSKLTPLSHGEIIQSGLFSFGSIAFLAVSAIFMALSLFQ